MVNYHSRVVRLAVLCAVFITICVSPDRAGAQNNGLLQRNDLNDVYRMYQLTDTDRTTEMGIQNHSFMIRPQIIGRKQQPGFYYKFDNIGYSRYYNDSLATGYNNESFFQATGWQDRITAGARIGYGPLELELQPELVFAQNRVPATIYSYAPQVLSFDGNFFTRHYWMNINVIDLPSRFGTQSITKLFPGQSALRYHYQGVTAAISTENIWWGPGIRNSLLMTNQAPGFLHFSLQTNKPWETKIGSFEGQFIFGKLDSSGITPVENQRQSLIYAEAYYPRMQAKRNLAGFMITWQPKWIRNLYLGYAASWYYYSDTTGAGNTNYPHTSSPINKYSAGMGSVSARFAMPEDNAEAYLEIGRANKPVTIINLFGDSVPVGYTAGFRKWFSLPRKGQFIEVMAEVTRLELPNLQLIYTPPFVWSIPQTNSWYTNASIRQGYTQYGQSLGAGIGPGSNSQYISASWVNGFKKLGLHVERVIHNEDFYYYEYPGGVPLGVGISDKHWTDLSFGFHGQWQWKNLYLAGSITKTSALNYQWVKLDGGWSEASKMSDKKNLNITLSVRYNLGKN